jgi:type IV pilus assembly protein PilZ
VNPIDKRSHSRVPFQHKPSLTFVVADRPEELEMGVAADIGLGGMFIETDVVLPFNTAIEVSIELPGEAKPFTLPARVRWSNARGMGVQFGALGVRETFTITELGRTER